MPVKNGKGKKTRIYECEHFEFDYDDLGKYCWCHNPENPNSECDVHWKVCSEFCPYFSRKKGRGAYVMLELTENDKALMAEAKARLAEWKAAKKAADEAEYKMYLRLKKKYEGRRSGV